MSDPTSVLGGIHTQMKHLAERQRVISQNLANSDTSGYKAREGTGPDFSEMLKAHGGGDPTPRVSRPRVALTGEMRSLGARPPEGAGGVILDRNSLETKPDGNNVSIEEQLLKMGGVQADFTALTNIYRKQMLLLKTAVGK